MEEHRGLERGSYIWGRSIHNTRIERLWYDVTNGFGRKWKTFFLNLERHYGLDTSLPSHIWLLHHLFLGSINQDAFQWAEAWNAHSLSLPTGGSRSPRDMFLFGMLEHGARGIEAFLQQEPQVDNLAEYGVDWDALDSPNLMAHYERFNGADHDINAFTPNSAPERLSEVACEVPGCPLTADQVATMDQELARTVDITSRDMESRCTLWSTALNLCVSGVL
ncbi:hypothetical protein C8Q78DRAFT_1071288 [Trametes maxima]|nr:hypothetical protein C8Q78DRAFT_1071288 [Trametes maxima]